MGDDVFFTHAASVAVHVVDRERELHVCTCRHRGAAAGDLPAADVERRHAGVEVSWQQLEMHCWAP